MTHIHPALRVALLSWLITRGGRYLALFALDRAPHKALAISASATMPVDRLLAALHEAAGVYGSGVLTGIAELCALIAILSIYNFCRKDTLPQTAERATWIFALSPLWLFPFGAGSVGASLGLLALASAVHGRFMVGGIAAVIATWCMPGVALIAPALYGLSRRARQPHTPAWAPWLLGLCPLIAMSSLVFAGLMLAGIGDISLRSLTDSTHSLRTLSSLQAGIAVTSDDLLLVAGLAGALVCAWRFAENTPRSWPLLTIPLLIWPLLHTQPLSFAPLIALAVPLVAYASKLTEDPERERPLLALCAMLSMLCIL